MKQTIQILAGILLTLWLMAFFACGQGTFIYDQQSAVEAYGNGGVSIQGNQPMGQSFTPELSSVGFIRLHVYGEGDSGATVYVNLWAGSIGGTLLGSSQSVSTGANFGGAVNFFFLTPVVVNSGTTYYFQPVLESGTVAAYTPAYSYNYPDGTLIEYGTPNSAYDMWFREGLYAAPEPSPLWLFLLGGVLLLYARRKHPKQPSGQHFPSPRSNQIN
jgi:hypothetical protein